MSLSRHKRRQKSRGIENATKRTQGCTHRYLQFKLLVPLRTQRVRFDRGRADELGRHRADRVPLLAAVLALEAQPKAVMLAQLAVLGRIQTVHAGVGQGPRCHRWLGRGGRRCTGRLNAEHAVWIAETCMGREAQKQGDDISQNQAADDDL